MTSWTRRAAAGTAAALLLTGLSSTALADSARADDFDVNTLCVGGATAPVDLTAAQYTALGTTLTTAARTEATTAGGLRSVFTSDSLGTSTITGTYDPVQQRAQVTTIDDFGRASGVVDAVALKTYERVGKGSGDDDGVAAAKLLKKPVAWVARTLKAADATPDALVGTALSTGLFSGFDDLGLDELGATPTYACSIDATGHLLATISISVTEDGESLTFGYTTTLTLDATGAPTAGTLTLKMVMGSTTITNDATGTIVYGARTVATPTPIVTEKAWRGALVKSVLTSVRKNALADAKKGVKTRKTLASKVKYVRTTTKQWITYSSYSLTAEKIRVATKSITNGIKVWAKNPQTGKNTWFTITVNKKTKKVTSKLHLA